MPYRFLPHTADVLVELESATFPGLFDEATELVRHLLAGNSTVTGKEHRALSIAAAGPDELLHHYVRELLTLFQVYTFVPAKAELHEVHPRGLTGTVCGEEFDERIHEPQPEVKAVTRHSLSAEQTETGWRASMVLDM